MRTVSWLLLLLLTAAAPRAGGVDEALASPALELPAAIDARWALQSSGTGCTLEQALPDFGTLRFLASVNAPLRLELLGHGSLFAQGAVTARRRAPAWHPQHPLDEPLGELRQLGGGTLIAEDPLASRLLLALYQGYLITLERQGRFQQGTVAVNLAGVGLRGHYDEFRRCASSAVSRSWLAVERSRISFKSNSSAADAEALARLEELAQFIVADPSVSRVYVDGHTDDSGSTRQNLRLSEARAKAVAKALESFGVAPGRLTVRYHGARYPVAGNEDEQGRARNRRATIRLERNWGAESLAETGEPAAEPPG